MREFLAVDAGGTSSRAVRVAEDGRIRAFGRAGGGNPTSAGVDRAIAAVTAALTGAMAGAADPAAVELVLLAHAGSSGDRFHERVGEGVAPLGVAAPVVGAGDVTALFASGTPEPDGVALIAGTGSIGGAIRGGRLARTVDGTGWLLGDEGSGFQVGHRVARAVVDDLDGGSATALTPRVLERFALGPSDAAAAEGRSPVLGDLIRALYALRPVELSVLAPLAFGLVGEDDVATTIVRDGAAALARVLGRVRALQPDGPLVFGGSVLVDGYLPQAPDLIAPLLDATAGSLPIPVADGTAGAAVLALRAGGVEVDAAVFATLTESLAALRG
ncbi:N-acetylglucosamine kinase [Amnibacterium kyonggiense]|uniref:N-acetylglucosamine kinase-like BadF-type ATPase n=1 Tax=Amnibacterium kyonggiense TaxID=595671 RepID=A0A4R7FL99_9MICO|nr:BadF/BadG/BcrA/BcrD ATPase family protein [Amnibacterium kyonggiense]TDS77181.1 N-acetylglucosamine kinase-like BadF-type ATPase [Amnibacterium kyonggiense]